MLEMLHFGREGRIRHDLLSTLTRPKLDANETRSEKVFFTLRSRKTQGEFSFVPLPYFGDTEGRVEGEKRNFFGSFRFSVPVPFPSFPSSLKFEDRISGPSPLHTYISPSTRSFTPVIAA